MRRVISVGRGNPVLPAGSTILLRETLVFTQVLKQRIVGTFIGFAFERMRSQPRVGNGLYMVRETTWKYWWEIIAPAPQTVSYVLTELVYWLCPPIVVFWFR